MLQQPQATAVAVLRVRQVLELALDHLERGRTDLSGPVQEAPRGPLAVLPMGTGHVLGEGGEQLGVAARMGGGDIAANPRLRLAVDKAKAQTMPKDNIERAIKRGAGETEGDDFMEIRYEGYGPGGTAVMVDCLTDNRNRTVADVRHAFTKFGGNLGADGSVGYLFDKVGQLLYAPANDEDAVMEAAIEAGATTSLKAQNGRRMWPPRRTSKPTISGISAYMEPLTSR